MGFGGDVIVQVKASKRFGGDVIVQVKASKRDVRSNNILSVLSQDEGGLPSLPSPISGKKYQWRLVDLDCAYRSPRTLWGLNTYYNTYLVLDDIPFASDGEPWEVSNVKQWE
ncbi:hypothetical protein EV359DRAFT_86818 [Lentinula novae-zelandiae]|nr:hypothetical protein EV359DRAFT_86818 [Lentinula novae-zelandiae]